MQAISPVYTQPLSLPAYIEELEKYLPHGLPESDVLLAINLHPDIISEFPGIAKNAGVRLIIAPVEEPNWLSAVLKNQVKKKCEKLGIAFYAPKPFCSLKQGEDQLIDHFTDFFRIGFPWLKIGVKDNHIATVQNFDSLQI